MGDDSGASRGENGQCPGRDGKGDGVDATEKVGDGDAVGVGIELDFKAALPAVRFGRAPCTDMEGAVFFEVNGGVIGVVAVLVFWGDPKSVTASEFEIRFIRAAEFFFEFFEEVKVVDEAEAENAWADVEREDEFDGTVGEAEVTTPSAIGDDVHKRGLGGMGGEEGGEEGIDFFAIDAERAEFPLEGFASDEVWGLGEGLGFAKGGGGGRDEAVTWAGDFAVGGEFHGPTGGAGKGGFEADVAEGFVTGGIQDDVAQLKELPPDGFIDGDIVGDEIDSVADSHLGGKKLGVVQVRIGRDGCGVGGSGQNKSGIEAAFADGGENLAGELEVFALGKGAGHVEDDIFFENALGAEPFAQGRLDAVEGFDVDSVGDDGNGVGFEVEGFGQFHSAEFGGGDVGDFGVPLKHEGPRHAVGEGEGVIGVGGGEVVGPGEERFGVGHGAKCGSEGEVEMGGKGAMGDDEVGGLNERGEFLGQEAGVLGEVAIGLAVIEDFTEAEEQRESGGEFGEVNNFVRRSGGGPFSTDHRDLVAEQGKFFGLLAHGALGSARHGPKRRVQQEHFHPIFPK